MELWNILGIAVLGVVILATLLPFLSKWSNDITHKQKQQLYQYLGAKGIKYALPPVEEPVGRLMARKGTINGEPVRVVALPWDYDYPYRETYAIGIESAFGDPFLAERKKIKLLRDKLRLSIKGYIPELVPYRRIFGWFGAQRFGDPRRSVEIDFLANSDQAANRLLADDEIRNRLLSLFSYWHCRQIFHDGHHLWLIFCEDYAEDAFDQREGGSKWRFKIDTINRLDPEKAEREEAGFRGIIGEGRTLAERLQRLGAIHPPPASPVSLLADKARIAKAVLVGALAVLAGILNLVLITTIGDALIISTGRLWLISVVVTSLAIYAHSIRPYRKMFVPLFQRSLWMALTLSFLPVGVAATPTTLNWALDRSEMIETTAVITKVEAINQKSRIVWARPAWNEPKEVELSCSFSIKEKCLPGATVKLKLYPGFFGYPWNYKKNHHEWMWIEAEALR